ncbi:MAG: ankyrin repeat domain-containing protein, partial [Nitrospirae bacterium]|nr:ankyrin repeat domain-containing protein [Nitrospirota bacterium]
MNKISHTSIHFLLPFLLILLASFTGCHFKNKESYRKEIEKMGIVYSEESFLNEIIIGNREIIDLFLRSGIDINARTPDGQTALMLALSGSDLDLFKVLIDRGADIDASDSEGNTALMLASFNGHNKAVRIL